MKKDEAQTLIGAFILDNLPDSIAQRKSLLSALAMVIPENNPIRSSAVLLRLQIEGHEKQLSEIQQELPLRFTKQP